MATQFSEKVINKALSLRPWIRKVAPDKYRVTPRTSDHGKYELRVKWDDGFPAVESCTDYRTGQACLGFSYIGYCYHSAMLAIHLLRKHSTPMSLETTTAERHSQAS